jgi:hypothetical protein
MPIKLASILSKIMGRTPGSSPSVTSPQTGEEWNKELDNILDNYQAELDNFYKNNIGNRMVRRNISSFRINEPPLNLKLPKNPPVAHKIPATGILPTAVPTPPPVAKSKKNLPINSIMESGQRLFRALHQTLSSILENATKDIHQYLIKLAVHFNHIPTDFTFRTLLSDLARGKIKSLDTSSKKQIVDKIRNFLNVSKDLQTWVSFFKRTESNFSKKKKV